MSTKTLASVAVALVLGSTSAVLAQTYQASDQVTTVRPSNGAVVRHAAPRAERRYTAPNQPYYSDEPWSSSFDPGNTTGGN